MELKKTDYGCVWYNCSLQFKQMLHMLIVCSQEPVTFTTGKFHTVSLQICTAVKIILFAFI